MVISTVLLLDAGLFCPYSVHCILAPYSVRCQARWEWGHAPVNVCLSRKADSARIRSLQLLGCKRRRRKADSSDATAACTTRRTLQDPPGWRSIMQTVLLSLTCMCVDICCKVCCMLSMLLVCMSRLGHFA
jgi:hypothetical protein